jgi:TolA-binding protein
VQARVTHGAGTDWRFLAGPFEVRVTGTSLGVEWDPARERFAVRVDEGSVAVRGPNFGEPQVVVAGQECAVDLASRTARIGPAGADARGAGETSLDAGGEGSLEGPTSTRSPPGAARPSPAVSALAAPAVPGSPWTRLADTGDYDGAYAAVSIAGIPSVLRSASGDELLRFAQVARLSGHHDTARDALVACRRRFPGSERASIAAYELGRASSPVEARGWFETYLREQPNGSLAREAAGRLVEARAASGDEQGARDAAARYLARYPGGPHAALARRILSGAGE